jgi:hypothetical protein
MNCFIHCEAPFFADFGKTVAGIPCGGLRGYGENEEVTTAPLPAIARWQQR